MSDTTERALVIGAVLLGILQGLTEFLPVSSSGHLVLFQQFFEVRGDHVLFDLVLHLGTLLPVLWFYRRSFARLVLDPLTGGGPLMQREGVRLLLLLFVASLPTAIIGLSLEDVFESMFSTPATLVITFALTGGLLYASGRFGRGRMGLSELSWKHAVVLGVAQGMAITPGISRSGSTIAVALMMGVEREFAARFSFLMSVPAILGAVLFKLKDVDGAGLHTRQLLAGGLASLVAGYLALILLVRVVKRGQFQHFAWYCWAMALVAGGIALARLAS